ncbi:MAG: hypothetical protein KGI97_01560 [Alphaproteobacteria bacterium]|nr:hypothetical protein [Alphaproteobacteria bacterium]
MTRSIVVTAANDLYLPLVAGLLRSLRTQRFSVPFDIGVLDVGLGNEARAEIAALGATVVAPSALLDYPTRAAWEAQRPAYRAQTERPFLRDIFPGYDVYMWMDADTWAQTPDAVETMLASAAQSDALHICSEIDRDYTPYFLGSQPWEYHLKWYRDNFPAETVAAIFPRPMLNSGVFALRADAPHWGIWAKIYAECLQRAGGVSDAQFMCDQLSLNVAVYMNGLPLAVMPAEHNWLTIYALPLWNEASGLFVRPTPPRTTISVLHLTHKGKLQPQNIATVGGEKIVRPLMNSI